jgi:RNA polymerase sigma-70 factor (ECF subfamily)
VALREAQPDSAETHGLLQRARIGDRQAFEQLFARHQAYLLRLVELRLAPQLRSRIGPEDIVQEAYVEALSRLDGYLERPALPFRLWLRQIACDRALKARRQHLGTARRAIGREVPLPERSSLVLAGRLLAGDPSPSQQLDHQETVRRLRQAVAQLPESDREMVMLRHFEELSNQEVACLLGIDPGTASKRHGRAMLRLHRLLFEGGMTGPQP